MPGSASRRSPLPYLPGERAHGRSHFNLRRLLSLSLDGLTAFTTWPLRIVSIVGMLIAFAALAYGGILTVTTCSSATRSPAGPPSWSACLMLFLASR